MACRVVRDNTGNIQYINSVDGERSELYDNIVEHINSMSPEQINSLKDTFEPWIENKKLRSDSNNELAFGIYERLRSEKGKKFLGDWEKNGEQLDAKGQHEKIEQARHSELLKPSPTLDTEEQGRVTDSIKSKVSQLTPEQHQDIVDRLINGDSRREIATDLGLKNADGTLQNGLIDAVRNYYDIPAYTSPDYDAWQEKAKAINNKYNEQLADISANPSSKELNINTVKGLFEGNTVTPDNVTYSATKQGLSHLVQSLFGGTEEQANASADLFNQQANAWAKRTGNNPKDYYKQLGFSNNLKNREDEGVYFQGSQQYQHAITDVANYLKLNYKKAGANFGGFVKSENGLTGEKLAKRIGDVLKEKGYDNLVRARWDKTHQIVEFAPKDDMLYQEQKGAFDKVKNVIYALTNPDITTFPHELAHAWEENLRPDERQTILDWADHKEWTKETSEKFAEGFESFLSEGTKTEDEHINSLFEKFAKWLADAYKNIKESLGLELNEGMRKVYSNMLDSEYVPSEVKDTIDKVENPEVTEQLSNNNDYNIVTQQGIDDNQQITVVDKNGQLVPNPNDDLGAFDNTAEAQAFIDSLGNEQSTQQEPSQSDTVEQPIDETADKQQEIKAPEYIKYKEIENGVPVEKIGKLISQDGLISNIQAMDGTDLTKLTDRITPASENEVNNALNTQKIADNEPTSKYKKGDTVVYGQGDNAKNYTITGVELREEPKSKKVNIGGVISTEEVGTGKYKVFYNTQEGPLISEEGIADKARNVEPAVKVGFLKQEHIVRHRTLQRIARRFEHLFPDIKSDISDMNIYDKEGNFVAYPFEAPARFYNGKVEINIGYSDRTYKRSEIAFHEANDPFNVPWLKRETVAHEYMHPFVEAMKNSNELLYNNLLDDLKSNQKDIIDHVNKLVKSGNYQEATKYDEGLAIHLGRELTKAFTKTGLVDEEYIKSRPLLNKFVDWLKDVINFITGKKKPKTLEQFISDANGDKNVQKENLKNIIAGDEKLKEFTKKQDKTERKLTNLKNNKDAVRELLDNDEKFNNLYDAIDTYGDNIKSENSKFEFIKRTNKDNYVEFDENDPNHIKVYIDPIVSSEYSLGNILLQYGNRLGDNDIAEEFDAHVKRNFYLDTKNAKKTSIKPINVKDLNPLMKLNDVSNLLIGQLGEESKLQVKYTQPELKTIDDLEAYMQLNEGFTKRAIKDITSKLPSLKQEAEQHLQSDTLKANYNIVNRLKLDKNDEEFMLGYFQQASTAINVAWRKMNEVREDIRLRKESFQRLAELNKQKTLTESEAQEKEDLKKNTNKIASQNFHKEIASIRQLSGFYENFADYKNLNLNLKDPDEAALNIQFQNSHVYLDRIRHGMNDAMVDAAVDYLTPYVEVHNKYIQQEGYTDEKYLLTPEKLVANLKYGTNSDTNFVTYLLGTNVTSRDPVNAVFANIMAGELSFNNLDIKNTEDDLREGLNKFAKEKGLTSGKAQEEYFKNNYYRKATVSHREYDKATGEYKDIYIDKYAIHQPYLFDKYEKDLLEERKKYSDPVNSEERELFDEKLRQWKEDRNFGKDERYKNKDYDKVQNDEFFKLLEKHYNESNDRFGEKALKFGLLPQKYHEQYLKNTFDLIKGIKAGKTAEEKLSVINNKLKQDFGAKNQNDNAASLDGTVYRNLNTNITNLKSDENLDLHAASSIAEYLSDSYKYNTLKQTQHSAETLLVLLEGNEKFGIKSRQFSQKDFTQKLRDTESYNAAKTKLKELDNARDNGEKIDEEYYKKVQDRIARGIQPTNMFDNVRKAFIPSKSNFNNELLTKQIRNLYYGDEQEQVNSGNISLNQFGGMLAAYSSFNNISLNPLSAVTHGLRGNVQMWIESAGNKHFGIKEVAASSANYLANIHNYVQDLHTPIKSKNTQLAFMYDAIQGEIHDEIGQRVTGNIARKMFSSNSLFFMTSVADHQMQTIGMESMMRAKKLKTTNGETISLYDSYTMDKNGRVQLRNDVIFQEGEKAKFTRDLQGVNRSLNGNFSDFNKTMLQYKWYGSSILKFHKYVYPWVRARFASEHTDYERNTVETGYLRYFFTKYLPNGIQQLMHGKNGFSTKDLQPHELYALRKTGAEMGLYLAMTLAAIGIAGTGKGKDKKELNAVQKFALLELVNLRGDYSMFNGGLPDILVGRMPNGFSEPLRQIESPTATLNTLNAVGNIFKQLGDPTAVYSHPVGVFDKGDSKMAAQMYKLIPMRHTWELFNGSFEKDLDNRLGYFNLVNKNVKDVSAKESAQ